MKLVQNNQSTVSDYTNEVDILQLFAVLWRGKLQIFVMFTIFTVCGLYFALFISTPRFTTTAHVVQVTDQEPVIDFSAAISGGSVGGGADQSAINTEIEILRSRELLEQLVLVLNLIEDPEFNLELTEPSYFSSEFAIEKINSWLGIPSKPFVELTGQQLLDSVVDELKLRLNVANIRQTYVFSITTNTENPEKSALIANTLAELYIDFQLNTKAEANQQAMEWLSVRLAELRLDLEKAETAVKDFNAATDLINEETLAAINRQIKELRERLLDEKNGLVQLQAKLVALRETSGDRQNSASVANDALLDRYLAQIIEDPEGGQKAFDERYSNILIQTELEIDRLTNQIAALEVSIFEQEREADEQASDFLTLQQLQREAVASSVLYEFFLSRLKETSVQSGIQEAETRVLSRAVVPLEPSSPRIILIASLAAFLGFLFGATIVFIRELKQSTFRAPAELEEVTGLTVLGQIPKIPAGQRAKILKYLAEKPTSSAAEAIRNLRTSVLLSDLDDPPQVIMSTSSVPGEGKTTQSLGLVQNLAGLDKKVLLIEGDIRKLVFAEYFDISTKSGLISVLDGRTKLDEATVYEATLNADVLIGEKSNANAADIFSSKKFDKFLKDVRRTYDYIVIDTPPVLAVPDARVIGRVVDAVIYTVKWDSTTQRQVTEGLKSLQSVGVKVSGLVLAQISPRGQRKYGFGDTATNYGSYHEN